MVTNVTYILDPNTVSFIYFYLPIMIILALSPFFIILISFLIIKNSKTKLVLDIFNLIYALLLFNVILPSFLFYSLSQIYQIIEYLGDISIAWHLYDFMHMLITVYSIISLFAPVYYIFGILVIFIDAILISTTWKT